MLGSGDDPDPKVIKNKLSIARKSFTMKVPLPYRKGDHYAHERSYRRTFEFKRCNYHKGRNIYVRSVELVQRTFVIIECKPSRIFLCPEIPFCTSESVVIVALIAISVSLRKIHFCLDTTA